MTPHLLFRAYASRIRASVIAISCAACASHSAPHTTAPSAKTYTVNWSAVDAAMGRTSVAQSDDVHRFNMPRSDLTVIVDGVTLKPTLALGSWLAMKPTADGVLAMGDMVLSADELSPVIAKLQAGGIEQTAIHHHVIRESPRVLYVHMHAHGDPVRIARAVHDAVALTSTPPAAPVAAANTAAAAVAFPLDTAVLAKTLGYEGRINGGVYQVTVARTEVVLDGGEVIPSVMGLGTAINFQPTADGKAAITGDFVLRASEVNTVIKSLRDGGIEVTSLHNHLLNDEPRLFFMHFWANDNAMKLARTLREALSKTASVKTTR